MEELRKLLQLEPVSGGSVNFSLDSGDSDVGSDSDVSYESVQILNVEKSRLPSSISEQQTRKRNGETRLPTRRPDPNVYNRNALLARENRRKKKAYLETLEKELEDTRNTNRALTKALKKQLKASRRLEQEKQYFKSLVANHTGILGLVNELNTRLSTKHSLSSPSSLSLSHAASYAITPGSSSLGDSYYDPEPLAIHFEHSPTTSSNNGIIEEPAASSCFDAPFSPTSPTVDSNKFLDNFFTDYDMPMTAAFDDTWHELLQEEEFIDLQNSVDHPPKEPASHPNNISSEHSYVSSVQKTAAKFENDPGVCLHITRGKVSLEFCPSCHWSAAANRTPPTQLMHQED